MRFLLPHGQGWSSWQHWRSCGLESQLVENWFSFPGEPSEPRSTPSSRLPASCSPVLCVGPGLAPCAKSGCPHTSLSAALTFRPAAALEMGSFTRDSCTLGYLCVTDELKMEKAYLTTVPMRMMGPQAVSVVWVNAFQTRLCVKKIASYYSPC